MHLIHSEVI